MRRFFYYNSGSVSTPVFSNLYSMDFDGVDEKIQISTPTGIANSTEFSISFWNKGLYNTTRGLFELYTSNSDRVFIYVTGGGLSFRINSAWTNWSITGINDVWTHFCFVFDGSQSTNITRAKIYINGTDVTGTGSGTIPTALSATSSHTRNNIGVYSTFFNTAIMDEFAWYNVALSSAQVTEIYNSGTPNDLMLNSATPLHWWRMGDGATFGTDWTISDVGTDGTNTGTSVNMESGDRVTDVP